MSATSRSLSPAASHRAGVSTGNTSVGDDLTSMRNKDATPVDVSVDAMIDTTCAGNDAPAPGGDGAGGRAAMDDLFAVQALAPLFRLLGDPSRLSIVFVCLHEAVCVSEIARATGLSPSLVSHHLRLLRGARVVRGVRRGKQIFYTAADDHVRRMIDDMREHVVECRQDD